MLYVTGNLVDGRGPELGVNETSTGDGMFDCGFELRNSSTGTTSFVATVTATCG